MFLKALMFLIVISFEMALIVWAGSSPLTHFLQGL